MQDQISLHPCSGLWFDSHDLSEHFQKHAAAIRTVLLLTTAAPLWHQLFPSFYWGQIHKNVSSSILSKFVRSFQPATNENSQDPPEGHLFNCLGYFIGFLIIYKKKKRWFASNTLILNGLNPVLGAFWHLLTFVERILTQRKLQQKGKVGFCSQMEHQSLENRATKYFKLCVARWRFSQSAAAKQHAALGSHNYNTSTQRLQLTLVFARYSVTKQFSTVRNIIFLYPPTHTHTHFPFCHFPLHLLWCNRTAAL